MLLSDGWELPFAEAIDWGKAAVVGNEKLLLQVPRPDPAPRQTQGTPPVLVPVAVEPPAKLGSETSTTEPISCPVGGCRGVSSSWEWGPVPAATLKHHLSWGGVEQLPKSKAKALGGSWARCCSRERRWQSSSRWVAQHPWMRGGPQDGMGVAEAGNPAGGLRGNKVRNQLPPTGTDPLCRPLHPPGACAGFPAADPVPVGRVLLLRRQDRAHHAGGDPHHPEPFPSPWGHNWGTERLSGLQQIIKDRLLPQRSRSRFLWNTLPGGLLALPDFSTHLGDFPFYYLQRGRTPPTPAEHDRLSACHNNYPLSHLFSGSSPSEKFTALIRAISPVGSPSQPILRLIQAVSGSQHCAQVGGAEPRVQLQGMQWEGWGRVVWVALGVGGGG